MSRIFVAVAAALLLSACDADEPTAPRYSAVPAGSTMSPASPDWTDAAAGDVIDARVAVRDAGGNPLAGVRVQWTVRSGGGSVPAGATFTDAAGNAAKPWTVGPAVGLHKLRATATDLRRVDFTANVPGGDVLVTAVAGDGQVVQEGDATAPFIVQVTTAEGAPVAGVHVAWAVTAGSAVLQRLNSTTNDAGRSSTTALPSGAQTLSVQARVPGAPSVTLQANVLDGSALRLDTVARGLVRPIYLTAPPGDDRLFIVEEAGRIRIVRDGVLLATPFLDLRSRVSDTGEQGLLSMAFHPNYASNGYFFVNFTGLDGHTRVERYTAPPGADVADPGSLKSVLLIEQPYTNHNGGHMLFGRDGRLYIASGDGGSSGDPLRNGQALNTLLGKILRINVDVGPRRPYAVPADNPFVGDPAARPEIWALGLRNPWRFAFDDRTLYIADVGQNVREEVNVVPTSSAGLNYGWSTMEGSLCFRTAGCDRTGLTLPALEYDHDDGCSIIGGFVYRGTALPEISGHYFYADFCSGWVRSFRYRNGSPGNQRQYEFGTLASVASFGVDGAGELYIVSRAGSVMKIRRP